ncbi:FHA domain-containing protein [Nonomuraea sp. B12E4]|uniref:FHA domain-containing protein n=1 Tax=Nonomuraea sp. B12E4 TaxID=3153564 RepID=UPI00325E9C2E
MTAGTQGPLSKVHLLPRDTTSLAHGLPAARPGTLFVRGANGGLSVSPDAGFEVVFGRAELDVHVCVGRDDPHVSRRHGRISHEGSGWVLHNLGRLAIRFPGSRLVLGGHWAELPVAYSPLFIIGPKREHLLEVRVAASAPAGPPGELCQVETPDPEAWDLSPVERLVLVSLAQRYLRQEPWPQPVTWAQVADDLGRLRPGEQWTPKRAAHIVTETRKRLSASVAGLLEEEIPPPLGNALNHNLITELLVTATLVPEDLLLLDGPG